LKLGNGFIREPRITSSPGIARGLFFFSYFCQNKINLEKGLVIKSTGSWFAVRKQDGLVINCKIKGSFRTRGIRNTNPVAVGGHVSLIVDGSHGVIWEIEPR